jgi:signal peptidase II
MKQTNKILLFLFSSLIFIGIDWQTKLWAKKHLFYVRSHSYFAGIFKLDYAENKGAALSLGANLPENQAFWILQILPVVILIVLLFYIFKNLKSWSTLVLISFSAIFAGGTANLIDRFLNNRHVVDFMILDWGWLHTGIFNFADVFISLGVVGILVSSVFSKR